MYVLQGRDRKAKHMSTNYGCVYRSGKTPRLNYDSTRVRVRVRVGNYDSTWVRVRELRRPEVNP